MGSTLKENADAWTAADKNGFLKATIESEAPRHQVILTEAVYLGVHEVT